MTKPTSANIINSIANERIPAFALVESARLRLDAFGVEAETFAEVAGVVEREVVLVGVTGC